MPVKTKDDYTWDRYTKEYLWEIDHATSVDKHSFLIRNSAVRNGELVFADPLHDNWMEIYHQVHRLGARSVFECGCGGCYHLYNIRKLMPEVEINGCDLLESQIRRAGGEKLGVPQEILARTMVLDFSLPDAVAKIGRQFDFVYTQAVIMHLSHDKALQFMRNMVALAKRHILMIEAQAHDFAALAAEVGLSGAFTRDPAVRFVPSAMLWTRK